MGKNDRAKTVAQMRSSGRCARAIGKAKITKRKSSSDSASEQPSPLVI